jgi:hypothetical protein
MHSNLLEIDGTGDHHLSEISQTQKSHTCRIKIQNKQTKRHEHEMGTIRGEK